jgi:hypothetical protein
MSTFVKALRSEQAAFLDHHPSANHLLNVIARRSRRTKCNLNMLEIGECFISFRSVGMTEQQYRTAKKQLQKWNLVEFKKGRKVTDKGTVALLLNSDIYDINADDSNGRPTEDQRKTNGSVTTNKECKNDNNEKNGKKLNKQVAKFSDDDLIFVEGMISLLKTKNPSFKEPNKNTWASDIRLMREVDGHNLNTMANVFKWANDDSFWSANIQSPKKFRKQWNTLSAKANQQAGNNELSKQVNQNLNNTDGWENE